MPLMDYTELIDFLDNKKFGRIIEKLPQDFLTAFNHGDFDGWVSALQELPDISPTSWDLQEGVRIGEAGQCNDGQREQLKRALLKLQPWRKGPFDMFGLDMDTEWRSDWKWDRLKDHISPLENRNVLDIGCGNGYHCWRMAGAGARFVLGVDSHLLFTMQYWAIRHFLKEPPVFVVPLALEDLPAELNSFDSVFSMGVLYHRRSPFGHLYGLKDCLRHGGELILETLVIEGRKGMTLVPQGRYARMPNVWFLPSCDTLHEWLKKVGFSNIRLVDVTKTSVEEQRTTAWMNFESLPEALGKDSPGITIESYPAPMRAIFVAEKP
ncbi:MAG: tRNA 5-methoxyuridine(34)/uridine 5-oxyacetic acid(34) synthase CmoB [Gammaproteobacteria bacterium]|nr:tRNA 5-methoxyuridine(34)/uridine 5-oxyacetic acid(34) synthase CmoB [Gammaproteobacteria bacterium]